MLFFKNFFNVNGIFYNFSCPRKTQNNGDVERKNKSLQEMARTLISEYSIQNYFWEEVVSIVCYILNRVFIRKVLSKTLYELGKGGKPSVSYFHIFGCTFYILTNKENIGKFDEKLDKTIFHGYSLSSKACIIYNLRTQVVEESMHLIFDEDDNTLEKRRIADLEELERTKISNHT